jgi:hypothetical protein
LNSRGIVTSRSSKDRFGSIHSQVFSRQLFSMGKDCNEGLSKAGRRITPRAS